MKAGGHKDRTTKAGEGKGICIIMAEGIYAGSSRQKARWCQQARDMLQQVPPAGRLRGLWRSSAARCRHMVRQQLRGRKCHGSAAIKVRRTLVVPR